MFQQSPRQRSLRPYPILTAILLVVLALLARPVPADEIIPGPKDVAALRELEGQIKKLLPKLLPCTVGVQVGSSRGSGVIVSEDGLVMTAGHVCGKPGEPVTFFFADGTTAKGKTLGVFKSLDAGMMKIEDEKKYPFAEKGSSADLKPGSWCVATGHPLGYQKERPPVVRAGRVLRSNYNVVQTDCALVGGDSGGPLFDLQGRVIGINSRIGGSMNMNFHVPVDVYEENWQRLVDGEAWELKLPVRDGQPIKSVLREVVAEAAKCVAKIKCDGKDAALGTIVGPDGWIVTKASELKGKIVCRLRDGREFEAEKIGVHQRFDLAMLKIDVVDLPAIQWNETEPTVGQWVVAVGVGEDPLTLGIVSVPRRAIAPERGILGIMLGEGEEGVPIERVLPKSPAEGAGLKARDIVTEVNGEATGKREELLAAVKRHRPGETVELTVKRGEDTLKFSVTLAKIGAPGSHKKHIQNNLGVGTSKRRDGFPMVLQHDSVLRPVDCGGPLVDLSGKVVGVNIARGGRTETYTVPSDILPGLMYELMSGRLTPADTKKKREEALADKKAEEERKKAEAEKKAEEERKKAEAERKAEEERKRVEAEKKAEEERLRAEAEKKAEEERLRAEAEKKVEEERKESQPENSEQPETP